MTECIPFAARTMPASMPLRHGWEPAARTPALEGIAPMRSVRIADLSPPKKRVLWHWLQENDPATAAKLSGPDVRRLMDAFPGASPVLDLAVVDKALS